MSDGVSKTSKSKKVIVRSDHVINIKFDIKWVILTVLITFFLSVTISLITTSVLGDVSMGVAVFILLAIIILGIFFDIVGMAVTAANEKPFHAMASKRVYGAKSTIFLIRNAEKVSNICNDIIGDICGIISGATSTVIVSRLILSFSANSLLLSLVITGMVAALTVGGKAAGKSFAISHCNEIIYTVGKLLSVFSKK